MLFQLSICWEEGGSVKIDKEQGKAIWPARPACTANQTCLCKTLLKPACTGIPACTQQEEQDFLFIIP